MRKLFYFSNLLTLCLILSSMSVKAQTITGNPTSQSVCTGVVAHFAVAASDTPSYIWQKSADGGTTWDTLSNGGAYANVTTDTLSVAASAAVDGFKYRAIVYKATGANTSNAATLTLLASAVVGTTTGSSSNICVGSGITLSNTVSGGVWSSTNTSVATVNSASGHAFGIAAGADTIVYTITNTCGSAVASYPLTVDAPIVHAAVTGPSTVCISSFITLTNANAGGVWTASNTHASVSSTGMVSGATAGVDTITYTYTNSCGVDVSSAVVTVEAPIAAGTISGPTVVCVGSLATFTATTAGGIWLSNNANVATVDLSGVATGRGQGTAIISFLFSNSCGSFAAMDTLQVDRSAAIITGSDSVGVGLNISLTDSAINGVWSTNDTSIATVNPVTGIVHGVATGTTSIVYTVTNSCGTSAKMITMHVGVPGTAGIITGADTLCAGNSVTLTSSVPGGVWTLSNNAGRIDAAGVFTGDTAHRADTVTYTVTNGFGTVRATKVIYVNGTPSIVITGPATVNEGTPYTLVATPAGGVWTSSRDTAVTFISANTFVAVRDGITILTYTVSNSCGTSHATYTVNIPLENSGTGVNTITAGNNAMSVFPNPNNGSFSVNIASAVNEAAKVVITNMVGAVVSETNVATNTNTTLTLTQPAGVYIVSAVTSTGKYTTRVVVAK